jgi:hypothetical protein
MTSERAFLRDMAEQLRAASRVSYDLTTAGKIRMLADQLDARARKYERGDCDEQLRLWADNDTGEKS